MSRTKHQTEQARREKYEYSGASKPKRKAKFSVRRAVETKPVPSRLQKSLAACKEKRTYSTFEIALTRAVNAADTYAKPMTPYQCPHCFHWHLTSKTGGNAQLLLVYPSLKKDGQDA